MFASPVYPNNAINSEEGYTQWASAEPKPHDSKSLACRDVAFWMALLGHELTSPLCTIDHVLRLLQSDTANFNNDQLFLLEHAQQATFELQQTIHHLLHCAEAKLATYPASAFTFELRAFLVALCQQFRNQAKAKGLHILLEVEAGTPNFWVGNPVLLKQVLGNLLSNSIKATSEGHVRLVVYQSDESKRQTNYSLKELSFLIEDTGPGIPVEKVNHLFQAFSNLEEANHATEPYSEAPAPRNEIEPNEFMPSNAGLGLGMFLAKSLTEALGGTIRVQNAPEKGCRFVLSLPMSLQKGLDKDGLKGLSMIFLTPADCHCDTTHEDSIKALGINNTLLRFEKRPQTYTEAPSSYEHQDFIYLCTGENSSDDVLFDWLADRKLQEQAKPLLLVEQPRQSFLEKLEAFRKDYAAPCLLIASPLDFAPAFEAIVSWKNQQESMSNERPEWITAHKILIVDNNRIHSTLSCALLEAHNHEVSSCATIEKALQLLIEAKHQKASYDVVLCDLFLEEEQGTELARRIRQIENKEGPLGKQQPLYIVALSACLSHLEKQWAFQAGMNAYLPKPLVLEKLYSELHLLSHRSSLDSHTPESPLFSQLDSTLGEVISLPSPLALTSWQFSNFSTMLNHNSSLIEQVLHIFLEDIPHHLGVCQEALRTEQRELLAREAHQIQGSCTYIHAPMLKEMASTLERKAYSEPIKDLQDLIHAMQAQFKQLQEHIQTYLNGKMPQAL